MVGISVPIAGRDESRDGRVVSMAGSDKSGAAEEPTEGSDESKDGIPASIKDWDVSLAVVDESIGGNDVSVEDAVVFGWSFEPSPLVCWLVFDCVVPVEVFCVASGSWFDSGIDFCDSSGGCPVCSED